MNKDYQFYQIYTQLTRDLHPTLNQGRTISDALHAFMSLKIDSPKSGDDYFEAFGVGNTIPVIDRPYERFACYEFLLQEIRKLDFAKFDDIHKGTPYYFLAWTAFEVGDYEKGSFYLDAALSEDIKKSRSPNRTEAQSVEMALNNPGGYLWRLFPPLAGPAALITEELRGRVERRLDAFRKRTTSSISVEDFINRFIIEIIKEDSANRTIISAMYSYIFEYEDRLRMLKIRSSLGGSVEPLLVHLFKGGLIFESLLRYVGRKYSLVRDLDKDTGRRAESVSEIGSFNYSSGFVNRYCNFDISETSMSDLIRLPVSNMRNAFAVTHKLRNITGHDLKQRDELSNPDDYSKLFEQESDAMLYIVQKEFL